ncbi:MAG: hypothetical protein ACLFS1_01720 [Opitutales bacterium]
MKAPFRPVGGFFVPVEFDVGVLPGDQVVGREALERGVHEVVHLFALDFRTKEMGVLKFLFIKDPAEMAGFLCR